MNTRLVYLFDPLCGWCYGAGGPLPTLLSKTKLPLELMPTGLFAGEGARRMDDAFAEYAWRNDQRIEQLTGQAFSARYRTQVLADRTQAFDSGPATVALTAVQLIEPGREFEALEAIQQARYVDGLDITRMDTLSEVLRTLGMASAADRLAQPDDALLQATQARTLKGRALLEKMGAQGVPTFILERGNEPPRLLHASAVFSNPDALARELMNQA